MFPGIGLSGHEWLAHPPQDHHVGGEEEEERQESGDQENRAVDVVEDVPRAEAKARDLPVVDLLNFKGFLVDILNFD